MYSAGTYLPPLKGTVLKNTKSPRCRYLCTVPKLIDFPRYNIKCSWENVILRGEWYHVFLYISCYIAEIRITFWTVWNRFCGGQICCLGDVMPIYGHRYPPLVSIMDILLPHACCTAYRPPPGTAFMTCTLFSICTV